MPFRTLDGGAEVAAGIDQKKEAGPEARLDC
jgi:hypothetical protein